MPRARSSLSRNTRGATQKRNTRSNETINERDSRLSRERFSASTRRNMTPVQELQFLQNEIIIYRNCTLKNRSAFEYHPHLDYINCNYIQIGAMNKICNHCQAKKWKDEAPGMCCAGGKVVLPALDLPEPIKKLLLGDHLLSNNFLNNLRKYNTLFQMTSFGAKEIVEGNFMPTFKIQGQLYHLIGSLFPAPGDNHQFLQVYFVSDADQISLRNNIVPNLKLELITLIQNVLLENNILIKDFKYNLENRSLSAGDDFKLIIHADRVPVNQHRGRYNAPTINEVAVLLVDEDKGPRDIVLHSRDGQLRSVSELHRSYDALQYPLMFPKGEDGYYLNIPLNNNSTRKVSCMQFYAYKLMVRNNDNNYLHRYKSLYSQFCVDMMAKLITERLAYIRHNQKLLRSDDYIDLRDAVQQDANVNANNIGKRVILPATFTGSPRYMHEKAQDAMTYVRKYGRPDLFITFTCNPEWPEIKNELFTGQYSQDRHDLISRVFHLKMKKLLDIIIKKEIYGKVNCYALSVEWQKRGLPHCHMLIWLNTKIRPDEIDLIISAEIPDKNVDPVLYEMVCKHMCHGPCGDLNRSSPCMKDNRCSKKFPRAFISDTQTADDGYPTYRRRSPEEGGHTATLNSRGNQIDIDNRWIVPYSPILLRCFNAHINVEFCNSVQAIRYICKYITKGSDQATFSMENDNDELNKYLNGRYICTSEATWRFFDFPIHLRYPSITHLAVHLENHQRIYFTEENLQQVLDSPKSTTLTAFFELCQLDDFAKTLLYPEVPSYYTWRDNKFSRRKRGVDVEGFPDVKKDDTLGRVYTIHPNLTECFYLRLLLHNVRGPTSFDYLKTVNGILHSSFQAACVALGLLENDDHWKETLIDASLCQSSSKLRELFAILLVFCNPAQPYVLWEIFQKDLCQDILYEFRRHSNNFNITYSDEVFNRGLIEIENIILTLCEKHLKDFSLPTPTRNTEETKSSHDTILPHSFNINELKDFVNTNLPKLVEDQRQAYNYICESVISNNSKIFFLDAPGGTGKTFLINLLLAKVRSTENIAIGVASSGIAATLINGGKTAHSTFKLPLNVSCGQEYICSIRKNSPLGKILQDTKLIVWDECTMSHRAHIEALNRSLQDIKSSDKLMGGVTVVFAGDFRQTLPVIARGTRADIIKSCLKSSLLWSHVHTLHLKTNMRVHLGGGNVDFPLKLLSIGNGSASSNNNGYASILDNNVATILYTMDDLISKIYPQIDTLIHKPYQWLCERSIITPRNISAFEINNIVINKIPGVAKEYKSIDSIINNDDGVIYPTEFLNSLNPAGFPPYKLYLKVGVPIILLRNLNPPRLCNGTRLQIKNMRNHIIEATILTGPGAGETALIPRIPMIPTDLPFQFKRLQFPIKLSFAITINKSQGQTFKYIGIDLRSECFSHGQLYVALSRTGNSECQYILLPQNQTDTKNIVYPEVLSI